MVMKIKFNTFYEIAWLHDYVSEHMIEAWIHDLGGDPIADVKSMLNLLNVGFNREVQLVSDDNDLMKAVQNFLPRCV